LSEKTAKTGGCRLETKSLKPDRASYVSPRFTCHGLSVITLGGSPGSQDSGAPGTQDPLGGTPYSEYADYGKDF